MKSTKNYLMSSSKQKTKTKMKRQEKKIKTGGAIDIHKAILKVAPKKGFVMPGHRYTGLVIL